MIQLHGVDADGAVVLQKKKPRRGAVLGVLGELPPCLIGMGASATSHCWARAIAALGHDVRLIPPAYVKPYVKRRKNDAADAEAICEAVTRPKMRLVPVKTGEQQSVLVLHRSRYLLMRQRKMLLNAIRVHLADFGTIAAQGPSKVAELVVGLLRGESFNIPEIARAALLAMAAQLDSLATAIRDIERRLLAWHRAAQPLRARAPVCQAGRAFMFKSLQPFSCGPRAHACVTCNGCRLLPAQHRPDHSLSTKWRQFGILVDVHPSSSKSLSFRNNSFLDPGRMDNLLKAHS